MMILSTLDVMTPLVSYIAIFVFLKANKLNFV